MSQSQSQLNAVKSNKFNLPDKLKDNDMKVSFQANNWGVDKNFVMQQDA